MINTLSNKFEAYVGLNLPILDTVCICIAIGKLEISVGQFDTPPPIFIGFEKYSTN